MNREILTVRALTLYLKEVIDRDIILSSIWVRGEISNFKHHSSGHMYFTLKDEHAMIRAVMFKGRNQGMQFKPIDGMRVIAGGYVSIYEKDGQYQLYVQEMQPDGVGALYLAFEQLKAKLGQEGLFDETRKKPIPRLPRKVGVITSRSGAALHDIMRVAYRRFPKVNLVVRPVLVEGKEAPPQIVKALELMNQVESVDVIILARGGGKYEDLWAFNDEKVARAIFACKIPVITGIGHETDFTIADFVADLRAPTPSAAAERAVPNAEELQSTLVAATSRLRLGVRRKWEREEARLCGLLGSPAFNRPKNYINQLRQRLDDLTRALTLAGARQARAERGRLATLAGRLSALSPLAVLARGYSLVRDYPGGLVVRSITQVFPGRQVEILLQDGSMDCTVLETRPAGVPVSEPFDVPSSEAEKGR